ncbi:hypothetical protein [Brachybacterium sp. UMB0905]|uniref:hypothetical protein n=1 Tax=Brachybacterium sp. UMB0905 TaxID=2069310 RepID=UPI000C804A6E|nr:hypothetical protein [Brachybacterium sp. UMB0905]PMC76396.1 hypothetical protein CJ197_04365 [Brachybacterium sp. UMB0905]
MLTGDTLFDQFEDYTTDLAMEVGLRGLIDTLEVLQEWYREAGRAEGLSVDDAERLAMRIAEHIADMLGMHFHDFATGAHDWCILVGGRTEPAAVAGYARAKARELGMEL